MVVIVLEHVLRLIPAVELPFHAVLVRVPLSWSCHAIPCSVSAKAVEKRRHDGWHDRPTGGRKEGRKERQARVRVRIKGGDSGILAVDVVDDARG